MAFAFGNGNGFSDQPEQLCCLPDQLWKVTLARMTADRSLLADATNSHSSSATKSGPVNASNMQTTLLPKYKYNPKP